MDIRDILSHVDHTLLRQTAVWDDIRELSDDAVRFCTASVCIPPCYVEKASEYLKGRMKICTVIGFPLGYATTFSKAFEAGEAIENGADEIDMVINPCFVKERRWDRILEEILAVRDSTSGRILKVIIETSLLSQSEKIRLCEIVTASGADFIKTSTGFVGGGATFDDVRLMREYAGPDVKIKASGGISSLEDAAEFLRLGADRLGTSRIVGIAKEICHEEF